VLKIKQQKTFDTYKWCSLFISLDNVSFLFCKNDQQISDKWNEIDLINLTKDAITLMLLITENDNSN
jgi:hypothetical protein